MKHFPVESVMEVASTLRVESMPLGVKRIVLARPDVRNAFDETMIRELSDAIDRLVYTPDTDQLRVLLLSGEGKVFSAGADIGYMKRLAEQGEKESFEDSKALAGLFYRLADFPTPVVAAVQGAAIGGGLGLTVCADYVLAEESAVFATSEVRLGIVPGVISPYILRKVSLGNAGPMMLTGKRMDAREAARMGLVQNIVPAGELEEALGEVLEDFLLAGPEAARRTKELLKHALPLPGPDLVEFTCRQIAEARCSEEGQKGLAAFFAKSPPDWAPPVGDNRKSSS